MQVARNINPTAAEKSEWRKIVEQRKPETFADLPQYAQNVYSLIAERISDVYPAAKLYVVGSRGEGTYLDPMDKPEIAFFRKQNLYKKGFSDYDLQIVSDQEIDIQLLQPIPKTIDVFTYELGGAKILIP
mgnify:CR=1 FL=1